MLVSGLDREGWNQCRIFRFSFCLLKVERAFKKFHFLPVQPGRLNPHRYIDPTASRSKLFLSFFSPWTRAPSTDQTSNYVPGTGTKTASIFSERLVFRPFFFVLPLRNTQASLYAADSFKMAADGVGFYFSGTRCTMKGHSDTTINQSRAEEKRPTASPQEAALTRPHT